MKHNNFIFKRILALMGLFDTDDIIAVFEKMNYPVSKSQIYKWKKITKNNQKSMPDEALQAFLNGLLTLSEEQKIVTMLYCKDWKKPPYPT